MKLLIHGILNQNPQLYLKKILSNVEVQTCNILKSISLSMDYLHGIYIDTCCYNHINFCAAILQDINYVLKKKKFSLFRIFLDDPQQYILALLRHAISNL